MQPTRRFWQALLRLSLIFLILCLLLAQLEVTVRQLHEQTVGLPNPLFPRDPLPPPSRLPFIGINIDPAELQGLDQIATFQELAATGIGWVRLRVAWDRLEPTPRDFKWGSLDWTIGALELAGLIPVLLLDGSPSWARAPNDLQNANGKFAPPANPAPFVRFARAVAMRYGDRVQYYQIWDEPNIAPHWGARHIEPVNYARMLKAASVAIRETDPNATIIMAALAPTADRGHLGQDESYFLNRVYATGAAPYFDAVAIQPFGFGNRPEDPAVNRDTLNFRRTLMVRQTMLDAGDGETPIWLMRYGWNRAPTSTWQSVSEENQITFTAQALEMAYRRWPWIVGMGWPAFVANQDASTSGFTLTPAISEAFRSASTTFLSQRRPRHTAFPATSVYMPLILWLLAIGIVVWRGAITAQKLPWQRWLAAWAARPAWQQGLFWSLLLVIYYFAVWPPLLLVCAIVAALGFLAQPRLGLALALLLLPFYDYHKEFDWIGHHWYLPPTQAVLLCLLPVAWSYRPRSLPRDRWQWVALSWLAIMLFGAVGAWYWPAYCVGMLNLVLVPLFLFYLIRSWATTSSHGHTLLVALAAGGVLVAGLGLIDWLQGHGTGADGMRRLTGLGYSSNHTALYLIRTLAISVGLMLATRSKSRWLWGIWVSLTGVALLLTGSRGAVLLGIPAGALFICSRRNFPLPSARRLIGLGVVVGLGLAVLGWMWRARIANIGTMFARLDGWLVALQLWFDNLLFGVGPDGFWWTFPARMWLTSDADPNLRHPHLVWLEFATSGGLLALAWLVAVAILLFLWVKKKGNSLSWLQIGLLTGLIASFAHAQVDAFQALSELAGWNWAALALLLALDQGVYQEEE